MTSLYRNLIAIALFMAALATIYYLGYTKGKANAENKHIQQQLQQLQAVIEKTESLTLKAQQASADLERQMSAQFEANLKTTKEIQHALKTTVNTRVNCVFPDDVMQQLEAARHRAAAASRATDFNYLLPTTRGNK